PYDRFHGKAARCTTNVSEFDTEVPSYSLYPCLRFEPKDFGYIDQNTPVIAVFDHLQPIFQTLLAIPTSIQAGARQDSDIAVVRPSWRSTFRRCNVIFDRLQRSIRTPFPGKLHGVLPSARFERLTKRFVFQSALQDSSTLSSISWIKQHVAVVYDFLQRPYARR